MPDLPPSDPAAHIHPRFREEFPSWRDLRKYVEARATSPAFSPRRALHQLVSVDLAHRIAGAADYSWILRGSLALPARPPPRLALPDHVRAFGQGTEIDPLYAMARRPKDIDLCARHIPDSTGTAADYADRLSAVVGGVVDTGRQPDHGIGLGGLVHYQLVGSKQTDTGRIWRQVRAQPIDPQRLPSLEPVDNPEVVNVDLSPPGAAPFEGEPEPSYRSTLALDVPGFGHHRPDLYPTAYQVADKLCTASVPIEDRQPPPTEHRFKDLFDLHYLTSTCMVDSEQLRQAVEANEKLRYWGRTGLPVPYRLYGLEPGAGEATVPWREEYERRRADPAGGPLPSYPGFEAAIEQVGEFADGRPAAGDHRVWLLGRGWLPQPAAELYTTSERLTRLSERLRADPRPYVAEEDQDLPTIDRREGREGPSLSR